MMRLCPKCGGRTEAARCPEDGTATLVLVQNPDSRLKIGTEINGRYRVAELIGQGGFGAVYKATSLATDQEMAIKVLGVSLDGDDSDVILRFFAEAQITAGLKHPNTIRVFDFGQTEGGALYIAMELLVGQDLNQVLKARRELGKALTEEETIRIASQTLRSLAEAHMAGLVHRDLKPHNIFLNEVPGDDPVVKVLDFGIAKRLGSNLTGTGQAFGTPSYMSPEQAQNKAIDARSDLYSLGVVMYQSVAGVCPFEGDNPLAVLLSHVTDQPPDLRKYSLTSLSEDFRAVIERALAKSPEDRFESAIAMRQALGNIGKDVSDAIAAPTTLGAAPLRPGPMIRKPGQPAGSGRSDLADQGVRDVSDDDATAAYVIPPGGPVAGKLSATVRSAENGQGSSVGSDDGDEAAAGSQGSGRTEAFFIKNEELEAQASTPAAASSDAVYDLPQAKSSGKGKIFALVIVVLLLGLGVVGAVTIFGNFGMTSEAASDKSALPVAVAAAAPSQPQQPAAVVDAGAVLAKEADVAEVDAGGDPDVWDAGGPVVVTVKIDSAPTLAEVKVNGASIGKTPIEIEVAKGSPVRAVLTLGGYVEKEILLTDSDGAGRLVKLTKRSRHHKPRSRAHAPASAPRSSARPQPKPRAPSKPRAKSALEERL